VIETRREEPRTIVPEILSGTSPGAKNPAIAGYALPVIATCAVIAVLYWGRVLFITAIVSVIIALILEPIVGILTRLRIPRSLATFIVGLAAATALYLGGLAAYNQLSGLAGDVPAFKENLSGFITNVTDRVQGIENATQHLLLPAQKKDTPPPAPTPVRKGRRTAPAPHVDVVIPGTGAPGAIPEVRIHEDRNPIATYVYSRLGTVYQFLLMASFVPFLAYFMLSWRDHIYRSFLQFFHGADQLAAARSLDGVAEMARAFVVGNFLIGLFLSAISWAAFAALHIPYPFLTGLLSGFLSLVPYIGMPLAMVPAVISALAGGDRGAVILLAFFVVLLLHLIAMNILYPKIVGARVHLNPLVVTFSLMFWGFLWDAAGLVLAIPITAGVKAVCDNVDSLRPFGRFLGD
jgi:predicted PurR-regulated permease PerM